MVETQVTTMVIKVVDLGCEKCHKKIKKILCKIPQIQNQIYVEEKNTVTITVVCCSPEKIKKKILGKGCGFIECVEIKPPSPPPIIHRHAQSCKRGGKLRIPMIGASVQHQPLGSNPVVMMDS
ncbi:HEAVY METAL TRANSPORT/DETOXIFICATION SUPERFAMILY PROTEIN [Salix purpurea]|uniref:HEAVY METAL TRANSPORT/DETOXIFICATION SUPERFAMILY PROTEIN n=1 Tax=Salix purpurea TaxID=77065 RepID=A0A9Q0Q5P2_SALPP|nr:HEAVY METAL TRANSPORT/DETOXIFICATION SUPERFAMILY PROTEIN [Salix purpurea]